MRLVNLIKEIQENYKVYVGISLCVSMFLFGQGTYALTDPYVKEQQLGIDLFLESSSLVWTPPTWLRPTTLDEASEDAGYWINQVLPYEEDRYNDVYMVIPQLGSVTPIIDIPVGTPDYETMKNGGQIDINKYLVGGAIEYVSSVAPGKWGKRVDFAHSNNFSNVAGRYNTIFANLMALDPGDQVWYFVRQADTKFKLYKYVVEKSYNTHPSNVNALLWDGDGADALIFGCTHGLDGRWMVEATYLGDPVGAPVPYVDIYADIPVMVKKHLDAAMAKIVMLPEKYRKFDIIQLFKLLDNLKAVADTEEKRLIIDYVQQKLADMYPEDL